MASFEEEGTMFQYDIHCHEIVEILFGIICLKFGKRPIAIHLHDGHYVLQYRFQTDSGKGIGVDDGYTWGHGYKLEMRN